MRQPDAETIKAFAHVAQNVPAVKKFISEWRNMEISRLPNTLNNTAVAQGRCQVLDELDKLISDSPVFAAETRKG